MRVAVLGGAGFIGQAFFASASHMALSAYDKAIDGSNLTQIETWPSIRKWAPDVILNVVANLTNRDTAIIALRLVDAAVAWAREGYLPHIIHLSSAAVYGEAKTLPLIEEMAIGATPTSLYALDKQVGERYLEWVARVGTPVTVIRPANVYGPRQANNVVELFATALRRGESPVINRSAATVRDFVFIDDLCQAIRLCIDVRPAPGYWRVYNVGTGIPTTLGELGERMRVILGGPSPMVYPERDGGIFRSVLSHEAITKALGWEPTVDLVEGLHRTYGNPVEGVE